MKLYYILISLWMFKHNQRPEQGKRRKEGRKERRKEGRKEKFENRCVEVHYKILSTSVYVIFYNKEIKSRKNNRVMPGNWVTQYRSFKSNGNDNR